MGIAGILDSLGWAILHSTWQGAIVALAVIVFRGLTKDSQASLRCGFQVLSLMAALLAFVATFGIYHFQKLSLGADVYAPSLFTLVEPGGTATLAATAETPNAMGPAAFAADATRFIPFVGMIWILGFVLLSLKYSAALWMTHQLRRTGLSEAPQQWQNRFRILVLNSGINRHIELFISDRVNGPMTLGFFKPIVLVPASFFTALPTDQVEAILLHEIAHIRRNDYMINLLQTAIRTVFFYHPAIHFVSRQIDDDRERACDDFAVAFTRDPAALARGLASLRLNLTPRPFAMAATDKKSPLVGRLERLVGHGETRRRPEHVVTSFAAMIVAAGLYAQYSPFANAHPEPEFEATLSMHPSGLHGNYRFETLKRDNRDVVVKVADDGSRWVHVKGIWHDVDKNPAIIAKLPETPKAPDAPKSFKDNTFTFVKSKLSQYVIDLDYYIASLEHEISKGNRGVDLSRQLEEAQRERETLKDQIQLNLEMPIAPEPIDADPWVVPAPNPAPAPVVKISETVLSGKSDMKPGIYLDGVRLGDADWSEDFEDRMDDLTDKLDDKMDGLEEYLDGVMDKYETYVEAAYDYPEHSEAKLAKAEALLHKALAKTEGKRAAIMAEFETDMKALSADLQAYADQTRQAALKEMKVAEIDLRQDLAEYQNGRADYHADIRETLEEALRTVEESREELMRELQFEHEDLMREAQDAQREATNMRREAEQEQREIREEARREAEEARREARRHFEEAKREQYAEARVWADKSREEQKHVARDFEEYREAVLGQLKKDGLISKSADSAELRYAGSKVLVNGRAMPDEMEDHYCALNEKYHIYKSDNTRIKITPERIDVENGYFKYGSTRTSQWTYSKE